LLVPCATALGPGRGKINFKSGSSNWKVRLKHVGVKKEGEYGVHWHSHK